jgi:hypothetical protein
MRFFSCVFSQVNYCNSCPASFITGKSEIISLVKLETLKATKWLNMNYPR